MSDFQFFNFIFTNGLPNSNILSYSIVMLIFEDLNFTNLSISVKQVDILPSKNQVLCVS